MIVLGIDRFDAKVARHPDGCLLWTAATNHQGYGKYWHDGRTVTAHRFAWLVAVVPIAEGLTLDHACHNDAVDAGTCLGGTECHHRRCVNVDHLELREIGANLLASSAPAAVNARKVRCPRGHLYDYVAPSGERQCRTCNADRARARRAKARA